MLSPSVLQRPWFYPVRTGRISSQACKSTPPITGKRADGSHFKGFECCNETALCNHMIDCGNSVTPTQRACASFSKVASPLYCYSQEICARDERCYVYKYSLDLGRGYYDLGCISEEACPSFSNLITVSKRSEGHHFKCMACCNRGSMRNRNLTCSETTGSNHKFRRDCSELKGTSNRNGSYTIYPYGVLKTSVSVYCEFDFDGTWTVIQKRFNGSVDFARKERIWYSYR